LAAWGLALNLTQSPYLELRMVPNPAVVPVQLLTLTRNALFLRLLLKTGGPKTKEAIVPCQKDFVDCKCLKAPLKQGPAAFYARRPED